MPRATPTAARCSNRHHRDSARREPSEPQNTSRPCCRTQDLPAPVLSEMPHYTLATLWGKRSVHSAPLPGVDRTSISPPKSVTARLTAASPSPRPEVSVTRVRVEKPCLNTSDVTSRLSSRSSHPNASARARTASRSRPRPSSTNWSTNSSATSRAQSQRRASHLAPGLAQTARMLRQCVELGSQGAPAPRLDAVQGTRAWYGVQPARSPRANASAAPDFVRRIPTGLPWRRRSDQQGQPDQTHG